jgi:replication-associated recombination protein RarA
VLVLERLTEEELSSLLDRAETELGRTLPLTPEARHSLITMADGDGRALLNLVEQVAAWRRLPILMPARWPTGCSGARRSTTSRGRRITT